MAGKNILLIGSSGGIGLKLADMFTEDKVIRHYCNNEPGDDGFKVKADVTVYSEVEKMINTVINKFGRIDVLIYATGVSKDGFAHKIDVDLWKSVININLVGAFNCIRAVLPHMRACSYGRIITLSSVVYQNPVIGTSAYSASKAGLMGLTRTVALENVKKGITCNTIALGYYDAGLLYKISDELREDIRNSIPMKRFGMVSEIFSTIQYLISTEYVTGQVLCPNGGLYMY